MKIFLWLIFVCSSISSVFSALPKANAIDLMLAAIAGVSATVAFAALAIIGAIERIGQPKVSAVPDEI